MIQIDRLRVMAIEAILEYESALAGGSEPLYPQWADDVMVVCERAEAAISINPHRATNPVENWERSFLAT